MTDNNLDKKEEKTGRKKTDRGITFWTLVVLVSLILGFFGGLLGSYYGPEVRDVIEVGRKQITVEEESATIDVVREVSPSVVSITSEQSMLDFFGQTRQAESDGTGFIVSEDGLIITNKHVVRQEAADYFVFTSDGREFEAEIVAKDPFFDIAFLKIEAEDLKPAGLGDSDEIKTGQTAIAIGNALGLFENTVTKGVISAIGRSIEAGDELGRTSEVMENMIQTDVAINPGNSGGPLVNIGGQVIGINTAIAGGAEGIGFAIPINVAKTAIESVKEDGKVTRPMIGIRYLNITKEFASRNNLEVDGGALIYAPGADPAIVPKTPAAKSDLKEGDIVVGINEDEIREGRSLISVLYKYRPGDKVTIHYVRDGEEEKTELTLAEAK